MVAITSPERAPEQVLSTQPEVSPVPKYLLKELQEIVEHTETAPELVHWYHFVPCAGVRYYAYRATPSPVERVRPKKL